MINKNKIKDFWQKRGEKFKSPTSEMVNLEPDPELQKIKTTLEQEVILPRMDLNKDLSVLDLGAGYGQWAFRFSPHVRSVTAVDYAESMIKSGIEEAKKLGLRNVSFIHSAAEEFKSFHQWDLVFISGLFMYLDDRQGTEVAKIAVNALKPGGKLVLRESASILEHRHAIENKWSEATQSDYSALYRQKHEFEDIFCNLGLELLEHGGVFPPDSPLNKWPETRLFFYIFRKSASSCGKEHI